MSEKEQARIEFHKRRELETNEHDFAFLDGFDAGAASRAHRVEELEKALESISGGIDADYMINRALYALGEMSKDEYFAKYPYLKEQADGPRS